MLDISWLMPEQRILQHVEQCKLPENSMMHV